MTDTNTLTPTDADIIALADKTRTGEPGRDGYILPISFARAVLAKWGSPAPASQPVAATAGMQPVARIEGIDEYGPRLEWTQHWVDVGVGAKLYTAAQVQAMLAAAARDSEPTELQLIAITTAYEQGVGKGHQAHASGKETTNPYSNGWRCDQAWKFGYDEGKQQAQRIAAAPSAPARVPLADEQIEKLCAEIGFTNWPEWDGGTFQEMWMQLARAIEAAHGITAAQKVTST